MKMFVKYDLFPYILLRKVEEILPSGDVRYSNTSSLYKKESILIFLLNEQAEDLDKKIEDLNLQYQYDKKELHNKYMKKLRDIANFIPLNK